MPPVEAESPATDLVRVLDDFFIENPQAAVLEDGRVIFDMASARYSLSSENGRCLLHLWSEERNMVRTVCGVRERKDSLRIESRRFGQSRPQFFEIVPTRDHRSPSTRDLARTRYQHLLERVLTRAFPGWSVDNLRTATDLEHSFGPAYTRGVLRRGMTNWALIAVNSEESPATIDGILTLGILWLAHCREQGDGKRFFEGLKVVVPAGTSRTIKARMAWLNRFAAKYELYELDARSEELAVIDCSESGNLQVKLMHAFNPRTALERCGKAIDRVLGLLDPGLRATAELRANGPAEVSLALHGLEFARIRREFAANSFAIHDEVTFGAGANETPLTPENEDLFRDLTQRLFENRCESGTLRNPLYRLQPERWLESALRRDIAELEPGIRAEMIYTQVPALSAGDRGMLDLLTVTHSGQLAVIEVKADDDLHLPLQALDYWCRVRKLHREQAFQRHGYFPGIELSDQPPMLYLIAPALRIHPATDTVLSYLAAEIPWEVIGLNEDWRTRRKVILRKRSGSLGPRN
ncbi:hypothetical protein HNQ77_005080 [Silvibacterium bohemicum]|uniref:DUF91 domain-containing protein n=1 Tax=Silvibacterium bohemicum TaxID=1577686 RepID=A0A841K265_9BACT|nr:hypothetical protein [Silvibacterium bohemicum]MBB6147095.1 hypothetical protein [Silvibacterium bohemicum]